MAMKTNPIDIVIGPIETYDDQLFGSKAAYESHVLIKDRAWSERLARFAKYLLALQRELPVPSKYKRSEARLVGTERVSTCRSLWSPHLSNKQQNAPYKT